MQRCLVRFLFEPILQRRKLRQPIFLLQGAFEDTVAKTRILRKHRSVAVGSVYIPEADPFGMILSVVSVSGKNFSQGSDPFSQICPSTVILKTDYQIVPFSVGKAVRIIADQPFIASDRIQINGSKELAPDAFFGFVMGPQDLITTADAQKGLIVLDRPPYFP